MALDTRSRTAADDVVVHITRAPVPVVQEGHPGPDPLQSPSLSPGPSLGELGFDLMSLMGKILLGASSSVPVEAVLFVRRVSSSLRGSVEPGWCFDFVIVMRGLVSLVPSSESMGISVEF